MKKEDRNVLMLAMFGMLMFCVFESNRTDWSAFMDTRIVLISIGLVALITVVFYVLISLIERRTR